MARISHKNIVCIGGGTGTFVVLKGLKEFYTNLSAIVTMSDSGGSNKRIRDEFGLLPTSDIRQCFVALSSENGGSGLLRKLFMYRFEKGQGISGMTFGNLFMAALSDILGSQEEAIRQTGKVLNIKGHVIPVSFTDTNLIAEYEDGTTLSGEHFIDEPPHDGKTKITHIALSPEAVANPEACDAIEKADLIVLGPGDLYTSLVPNLLVKDISRSIQHARAKKVYVLNLMTKSGQTYGYKASDHLRVVESYVGRVSSIILHEGQFPEHALDVYKKYNEFPVKDDLKRDSRAVRGDIVNRKIVTKSKSDALVRSLIRHDSARLAGIIIDILEEREKV
ncbi:YvcK family protein [Candidatus Gottesmanbacteria bacterium]|nr:YvcK family protein [Candidatus Gottesmanbacteria bacterium]